MIGQQSNNMRLGRALGDIKMLPTCVYICMYVYRDTGLCLLGVMRGIHRIMILRHQWRIKRKRARTMTETKG